MGKFLKRTTSALLCFTSIFFSACEAFGGNGSVNEPHVCNFDKKVISEEFLKAEVSCKNPATYYYSCECGKKGVKIFYDGKALLHDLTAEVVEEKYKVKDATCYEEGEYYKSCVMCGQQSYTQTFKTEKCQQIRKKETSRRHKSTFQEKSKHRKHCCISFGIREIGIKITKRYY